jgi:hypothetical protein
MIINDEWIDGYKAGINAAIDALCAKEKRVTLPVKENCYIDLKDKLKKATYPISKNGNFTFGKIKRPRGRPRKSLA